MSRIKGKNTGLEKSIFNELRKRGLLFRRHVANLPGKPDLVFQKARVVVFIDGDFWHGYRLPQWEHSLSAFWKRKINGNRKRDQKNHRKLRAMGWKVIRLWQHQIKNDFNGCINRIIQSVGKGAGRKAPKFYGHRRSKRA
jgi:DNA mismatch endonuclease (patch repair protein)